MTSREHQPGISPQSRFLLLAAMMLLPLGVSASDAPGDRPAGSGSRASAAAKPNVLFIVADDLRPELGCYGGPARTPNLDRLATRGVRFDRAYCQQALCNPSRSSFLTGRRPDQLHLWVNGIHFREQNRDVETLPGWFKRHGYVTRNVGKIFHNWHTKTRGDRQSWSADEFLHYANHGSDLPQVSGELPPNRALTYPRLYGDAPLCERRDVADEAYFDGRVAAEAVRLLQELRGQPFFLAVGFWKPHAPFNPPAKYWQQQPAKLPRLDPRVPDAVPPLALHDSREILGIPPQQIALTPAQIEELRHGYLAAIHFLDSQVGKVLEALEKNNLTDKTIIIFLSDHGYHLGEHGLWAKTSCFELDARVPLIISPPRWPQAGSHSVSLVELIDLFPTLTELCGLPKPEGLAGHSLVPVLNDPRQQVKTAAITQHPRPAYYDRTEKGRPDAMGYSLRSDRVRYTEWRDWETGKILARELYDHQNDPGELRNAIGDAELAAVVAEAKQMLDQAVPPEIPPSRR